MIVVTPWWRLAAWWWLDRSSGNLDSLSKKQWQYSRTPACNSTNSWSVNTRSWTTRWPTRCLISTVCISVEVWSNDFKAYHKVAIHKTSVSARSTAALPNSGVFMISIRRRRGAVGVEGWGVVEGAWTPPQKKNHFCLQNVKFGCILTQVLTGRKHAQSLAALGHVFYGSIAKRSLQNIAKIIPNSRSDQRGVAPPPFHRIRRDWRTDGPTDCRSTMRNALFENAHFAIFKNVTNFYEF